MTEKEILGFDPNELNIFRKEASEKTKTKIYLAGKIDSIGDWRNKIIFDKQYTMSTRVCSFMCWDVEENGGKNFLADEALLKIPDVNIYTCGPFFISCDHSCFHGQSSHGVGLNQITCCDEKNLTFDENDVKEICMKQIDRSDLVLAYIDSPDCYGTLYEIAYAKTIGKPVILVFSTAKLKFDMWFYCDKNTLTLDECNVKKIVENKVEEVILEHECYDVSLSDLCAIIYRLTR